MIKNRSHGIGGQEAVTAVELLVQAVIAEGKYAQEFPHFGSERRGAPEERMLRASDNPISLREKNNDHDVVVDIDASLLDMVKVSDGLRLGGMLVINLSKCKQLSIDKYRARFQVSAADASMIALETIGIPITNTAIIESLLKARQRFELESIVEPMRDRFGMLASKKLTFLMQAFEEEILLYPPRFRTTKRPGGRPTCSYAVLLKSEALFDWESIHIGCDIDLHGSTAEFNTWSWRTSGAGD